VSVNDGWPLTSLVKLASGPVPVPAVSFHTLTMVIEPVPGVTVFSVFVKVQVSVSPAARSTLSVLPVSEFVLVAPPVQVAPLSVQPVIASSVKENEPAARSLNMWLMPASVSLLSEKSPTPVPVAVNEAAGPVVAPLRPRPRPRERTPALPRRMDAAVAAAREPAREATW